MQIRAAVLEEFGKPLVVQDVELSEPRAGEVTTSSSSLDLSDVIQWIAAPTKPPMPSSTPPPPPRPIDARACDAGDVSAQLGERNGAGGHLLYPVRFRNVSTTTCVLIGYPRVLATEPDLPSAARAHREALISADAVVLVLGARDQQLRAGLSQLDLLLKLTERYCVVYQTIKNGPKVSVSMKRV